MGQLDPSYLWYAVASEDGGAISLAVISRVPMKDAKIHGVEGARPIIETQFEIDTLHVYVFAVHAKSNLGDEDENIELRRLLGQALEELTFLTLLENPDALVIIAGDFNEEPWDGNVIRDSESWRCFWEDYERGVIGSYYYDESWRCYDNILLSSDMIDSWGVVSDGITTTEDGLPNRWDRVTLSGVSDHLPIWVRII
jgi:endonuclease/exonuclease/phosphatase family metal-dependent hydrolase